jgi:hypothetical protein
MFSGLHARTSSALSSAIGLIGLLAPELMLPDRAVLSSNGCKNFIIAVNCAGLDWSMVCFRYLQQALQSATGDTIAFKRVGAQVQALVRVFLVWFWLNARTSPGPFYDLPKSQDQTCSNRHERLNGTRCSKMQQAAKPSEKFLGG